MIPAPLPAIATSQQAWDILREDVTLRHSLMVREWNEQQQNVSRIDFESNERGDSWYFPDRIDAEIKITDERAQELYDACCEVWESHRLSKNRAFYRAVFEYSLQPLFDTRQIGLRCDIARYYIFKGIPERIAAPAFLATGMDELRSKWNTKLEIATRDSEARERAARAREVPTPGTRKQRSGSKPKKLTNAQKKRRAAIFGALQLELRGLKYCKALDERNVQIQKVGLTHAAPQPTWQPTGRANPGKRGFRIKRASIRRNSTL